MNRNRDLAIRLLLLAALCVHRLASAALPSDWRHVQDFTLANPGLVKIALPLETLDAARPNLEDLRLYDDAGNEAPYLVALPVARPRTAHDVASFKVSLLGDHTVITIDTGLSVPIDALLLETPAVNFIKAAQVEATADGAHWQKIGQGRPLFRQTVGVEELEIALPPGVWESLRLTIDDARSTAIPFTGAKVVSAEVASNPPELLPALIKSRDENPGQTRLTLDLGAANLDLASLEIQTSEPLFRRYVSIAAPEIRDGVIRESIIGRGAIYRVAVDGQPAWTHLSVPLEQKTPSRALVLLIDNGDSPPLPISTITALRRPVYLVFLARSAGRFHVLTGNQLCAAPRYDLADLSMDVAKVALVPAPVSALADNPDYRAPQALPGLDLVGAPLDTSAWRFRKNIQISHDGVQQMDLDLDVLSRADPSFADLRLKGGVQVPYILETTSLTRSVAPIVTATNDPGNPQLSRWLIKLPRARVPWTRLVCASDTPLFQRDISLSEELTDDRGAAYRHQLGTAQWTRTPASAPKEFFLTFTETPQTDTLLLETANGDNPPIALTNFSLGYPVTRLIFKAKAQDSICLYFGNPTAQAPHYDLSLVAGDLLRAEKSTAALDPSEDEIGATPHHGFSSSGGAVFWGILALVVVGLLAVISRLLPKPSPPA